MSTPFPELSRFDNFSTTEHDYFRHVEKHFTDSPGSINDKLNSFARYVPRQAIATFLARKEIFDKIVNDMDTLLKVECLEVQDYSHGQIVLYI